METPALKQLVRGYFHQDWMYEFDDDPDRALDEFIRRTPDLAPRLPSEIADVLGHLSSDQEVRDLLDALGSEFTPAPEDGDYRTWLQHVADRARVGTEQGRAGPENHTHPRPRQA